MIAAQARLTPDLLSPLARIVDALLNPLRRRVRETPRQKRLRLRLEPLVEAVGGRLADAEDLADLADLLDIEALGPDLLGFEYIAITELADDLEEAFAAIESEIDDTASALADVFGAPFTAEAHRMAALLSAHFHLLGLLLEADAFADFERFDPLSLAGDLACPPELSRAASAGLRSEAAFVGLLHGLDDGLDPWLRRALVESAVADRALALSFVGAIRPELSAEVLRPLGIEPAPLPRWLETYDTARAALDAQVTDAEAGRRRPFAPGPGDDG